MGKFLKKLFAESSDDALRAEREVIRQEYSKTQDPRRSDELRMKMNYIDNKLSTRAEQARKNDPQNNKDPNYHWTDKNRWE